MTSSFCQSSQIMAVLEIREAFNHADMAEYGR